MLRRGHRRILVPTLAAALLLAAPADDARTAPAAAASENPWAGLTLDALSATTETPLFAPGRRGPVAAIVDEPPPPAPAEPAAPVEFPPTIVLVGVVVGAEDSVALLQDRGSGQIHRLRRGDMVADWRLVTVGPRAVELVRDGRRHRLVMFAPDGNGTAGAQ